MSDKDLDKNLMSHNYDGIQELDNPMPSWWLATFFGTIIFSVIYWLFWDVSGHLSTDKELAQELAKVEKLQEQAKARAPQPKSEDLQALMNDPQALAMGQKEYIANCAACHGDKGQGLIGPNLTDKYWIHRDGDLKNLVLLISAGVPEKGMPAWENIIRREKIPKLAAYVKSLQGTQPEKAKDPEGELIE